MRKTLREYVFSRKELVDIVKNIKYPIDKALICFLYLYGCRIGEALALEKKDIKINVNEDKSKTLEATLITEKNPDNPIRVLEVFFEREKGFVDEFLRYYRRRKGNIVFPISRTTAWRIVKKHTGYYPHILRHTRTTHLKRDYGLGDHDLMIWHGWKTFQTTYFHIIPKDLLEKMKR